MKHRMTGIHTMVLLAALGLLSACSAGTQQPGIASVEGAYASSGAVIVQPYTRTIFSSNNF